MKKINQNSVEFKNFKEAVERNKLKNSGVSIDVVVSKLKACNVKLSKAK